jgi:hypothetical protein
MHKNARLTPLGRERTSAAPASGFLFSVNAEINSVAGSSGHEAAAQPLFWYHFPI